jgi:hypothetical protein
MTLRHVLIYGHINLSCYRDYSFAETVIVWSELSFICLFCLRVCDPSSLSSSRDGEDLPISNHIVLLILLCLRFHCLYCMLY